MPHIHDKIDFTVEVFIVYKDKVLLRIHDKLNIWCSIGGHIELDEDPVQAAIREVKEEVGLDVKIIGSADGPENGTKNNREYTYLISPRYLGKHPVSETHTHVTFVYFAEANTDTVAQSINEHERSDTKWVSKDEIEKMDLVPNIRFYAQEALKELSK